MGLLGLIGLMGLLGLMGLIGVLWVSHFLHKPPFPHFIFQINNLLQEFQRGVENFQENIKHSFDCVICKCVSMKYFMAFVWSSIRNPCGVHKGSIRNP